MRRDFSTYEWHGDIRTTWTWWGELHYGTERDLKALGLGVGLRFPTDEGRRRSLRTQDPRGLPCTILTANYLGLGPFVASIQYPDRIVRPAIDIEIAPGVNLVAETYGDIYTGTGEALDAAGVVPRSHLPGMPNMRKTRVRLLADGRPIDCALQAKPPSEAYGEGAKTITRRGKLYVVSVAISKVEREKRLAAEEAQQIQWMNAPRPRSLFDLPPAPLHLNLVASSQNVVRSMLAPNRSGLRLVHSAARTSS